MSEQAYALSVPPGEEPVKYKDVVAALIGEKRNAKGMIGKTFLVVKGRPFASSYENVKFQPWFVICIEPDTGEKFHMVLGGEAIVPILMEYAASKPTAPLQVTLDFVKDQGEFEGYYIFK